VRLKSAWPAIIGPDWAVVNLAYGTRPRWCAEVACSLDGPRWNCSTVRRC